MSHIFIYLDESGCLGFTSPHATQYFVITLLKIEGTKVQKEVMNAVRRTIKNKISSKSKKSTHELKGSKTAFSIKEYFMRQMPCEGWKLYSVILNKKRVEPHLRTVEGKKRLYNFLAKFLLENLEFDAEVSRVDLYIDKCKNSKEQKDFNTYITAHLNFPLHIPFNISHVSSHEHPAIQAVDLFCWGIAQKYEEKTDTKWYDKFRERIGFEKVYLPDKKKKGEPSNTRTLKLEPNLRKEAPKEC